MVRVLFLSFALISAHAGPGFLMTFSVALRQTRPFPTLLMQGGVLSNATIKNTTFQYNWFRRFQQFVRYISPDDHNGGTGLPMTSVVIRHNLIEPSYQFSGPRATDGRAHQLDSSRAI